MTTTAATSASGKVVAWDKVRDWEQPFRLIVEKRYYVVDKVYGRDDRVRRVMEKLNEPLDGNDFQGRNEGAMAAHEHSGKAFIGTNEEVRSGTSGMDLVELWTDNGAFAVQERTLERTTERGGVEEGGTYVRELRETLESGEERMILLRTPKAPRRRSARLLGHTPTPPPAFNLTRQVGPALPTVWEATGWAPKNEKARDPASDWGGTATDWNGTDGVAREWEHQRRESKEPEDEDMGSNMSIEDCGGCRKLMAVITNMSMTVKGHRTDLSSVGQMVELLMLKAIPECCPEEMRIKAGDRARKLANQYAEEERKKEQEKEANRMSRKAEAEKRRLQEESSKKAEEREKVKMEAERKRKEVEEAMAKTLEAAAEQAKAGNRGEANKAKTMYDNSASYAQVANKAAEIAFRKLEDLTREATHKEWRFFTQGTQDVGRVRWSTWNRLRDDANRIMGATEGMEGWVMKSVDHSVVNGREARWVVMGVPAGHSRPTVLQMLKESVISGLNIPGGKIKKAGIDIAEAAVVVIEGVPNA